MYLTATDSVKIDNGQNKDLPRLREIIKYSKVQL